MQQRIAILGCGWLGYALAKALIDKAYIVYGSSTHKEKLPGLKAAGISPYLLDVSAEALSLSDDSFFDVDICVITIPFRRGLDPASQYVDQIKQSVSRLSPRTHTLIFTSSTAVYSDHNSWVDESTPLHLDTDRQASLHEVETHILESHCSNRYVLRLGGLYGPDRELSGFLKGKTIDKPCRTPVNLIHQKDAVALIEELIKQCPLSGIYNGVSDEHPTREVLYGDSAHFTNFGDSPYKLVSNKKIVDVLGFSFSYPNPLRGKP
jgi:nucleoside-diphosphate-sugar epimerase